MRSTARKSERNGGRLYSQMSNTRVPGHRLGCICRTVLASTRIRAFCVARTSFVRATYRAKDLHAGGSMLPRMPEGIMSPSGPTPRPHPPSGRPGHPLWNLPPRSLQGHRAVILAGAAITAGRCTIFHPRCRAWIRKKKQFRSSFADSYKCGYIYCWGENPARGSLSWSAGVSSRLLPRHSVRGSCSKSMYK